MGAVVRSNIHRGDDEESEVEGHIKTEDEVYDYRNKTGITFVCKLLNILGEDGVGVQETQDAIDKYFEK